MKTQESGKPTVEAGRAEADGALHSYSWMGALVMCPLQPVLQWRGAGMAIPCGAGYTKFWERQHSSSQAVAVGASHTDIHIQTWWAKLRENVAIMGQKKKVKMGENG